MDVDIVNRNLREIRRLLDEIAAEIEPPPARTLPAAKDGKRPLPRMRTLPQAVKEIQAADPQTCITLNALRKWVKSGEVPSKKAGKNYLVDLIDLERVMGEG